MLQDGDAMGVIGSGGGGKCGDDLHNRVDEWYGDLTPTMGFGKLTNAHERMGNPSNNVEVVDRFVVVAKRFCSIVDSASDMDRTDFVAQIYRILPKIIDQAIEMPDVERSDRQQQKSLVSARQKEWERLYDSLKEKLGDWDLYRQVFDPTQDSEAIFGSLADDIADIYRDLKKGLVLNETSRNLPEDIIWEWRLLFHSHWGKHAIDALLAIHFQLQNAS
jgi:hypothetical protein